MYKSMNRSPNGPNELYPFRFRQFHIDVARNSTDDFNPFHDPSKWSSIAGNAFTAPLVSVFQLECLIEFWLRQERGKFEKTIASRYGLKFCNYDFVFPDSLCVNEDFNIRIDPISIRSNRGVKLVNRVWIGNKKKTFLTGRVCLSKQPLHLTRRPLPEVKDLEHQSDITYTPDGKYFFKRKYLTTANAKNFLTSSLASQAFYFDETSGRVNFPDMMPVSYIASALNEKDFADNVNFLSQPMLYARHRISVDRDLASALKSNDQLLILIEGPEVLPASTGLGQSHKTAHQYACFGFTQDNQALFRAETTLVSAPGSTADENPMVSPELADTSHD